MMRRPCDPRTRIIKGQNVEREDTTPTEELAASEEQTQAEGEELEAGQPAAVDEEASTSDEQLPEKWAGKSAAEIARSHEEAQRTISRLGSEKSHIQRELEAERARRAQMEAMFSQRQPAQQQASEEDPLQVFEKTWDNSPREAIKKLGEGLKETFSRRLEEQTFQSRAAEQARHYERLKQENPEFAELEPVASELAARYGRFLTPEARTAPEAVEMFFNMAKAQRLPQLAQKEAAKSKIIRSEKVRASSESARTAGTVSKDPWSMSKEELEKMLGFADKD